MKFHYHLRHESDGNQRKVKKVLILISLNIYFAFFPLMLRLSTKCVHSTTDILMMWLRFDLISLLLHATLKILAWLFPKVDENFCAEVEIYAQFRIREIKGKQKFFLRNFELIKRYMKRSRECILSQDLSLKKNIFKQMRRSRPRALQS